QGGSRRHDGPRRDDAKLAGRGRRRAVPARAEAPVEDRLARGSRALSAAFIEIPVARGPLAASVRPPGSKSITNRALVCAALAEGSLTVDGTPRMPERPIQDLLDALAQCGVDARSLAGTGCPPVEIRARGLRGGAVSIRGDVSSQFLSGLLLAAPYAATPLTL